MLDLSYHKLRDLLIEKFPKNLNIPSAAARESTYFLKKLQYPSTKIPSTITGST